MLFSLIIPCYNADAFLAECLDSVFSLGVLLLSHSSGMIFDVKLLCIENFRLVH